MFPLLLDAAYMIWRGDIAWSARIPARIFLFRRVEASHDAGRDAPGPKMSVVQEGREERIE